MSEPESSQKPPRDRAKLTATRIVVWVVVGGIGLYLLISGIVGVTAKG